MGASGQDSVWAGNFQGFFNLSLQASDAHLRLDIVDQMWVQFRMGSEFPLGSIDFERIYIFWSFSIDL